MFRNYDAAFSYNGADSYALAISLLSDRLRGRPGVQQPWPTDDPPTSRAERRELQRLLIARGHDVGEPDGAVGAKTRAAIIFSIAHSVPHAFDGFFGAVKKGGIPRPLA